jgi:Family of unknown function (DUF6295)
MCTSIIEIARAEGMAKRGDEWFPLSQAVVAYDHARHAPLGDVITLDFINIALEPGARAGIELTLETAKELRAALDRAIAAAEFEEAEVRGKGAVFGRRNPRATGAAGWSELGERYYATPAAHLMGGAGHHDRRHHGARHPAFPRGKPSGRREIPRHRDPRHSLPPRGPDATAAAGLPQ